MNRGFNLQVNHRQLLDGMFAACGVPSEKFKTVCSSIDKLDKESWEDVRKEIINEKFIDASIADKIRGFVLKRGRHC